MSLTDNEKTEIRLHLMNELMSKHETMLYFIRNKLAALLVSIARYDWPHLYPDFFSNIVEVRAKGKKKKSFFIRYFKNTIILFTVIQIFYFEQPCSAAQIWYRFRQYYPITRYHVKVA